MFDLSTSVGDDSAVCVLYIDPYDYLCNEMDRVRAYMLNICSPSDEFMS